MKTLFGAHITARVALNRQQSRTFLSPKHAIQDRRAKPSVLRPDIGEWWVLLRTATAAGRL